MSSPPGPHFDRFASNYQDLHRDSIRVGGEGPDYFAAYKVDCMARRLGAAEGERLDILDFGCGIGSSIPHLHEAFPTAQIYGYDVSGNSVEVAREAYPDGHFGVISDAGLALSDASIDVVMAACVYHHIPPSERAHWTFELLRVVKPGGHVFIFEHNPLNPLTRMVVRDCAFDEDAILLPPSESLAMLRNGGFSGVEADYIVFFPKFLAFLRPLERFLVNLPLGAQYVAHAQKPKI